MMKTDPDTQNMLRFKGGDQQAFRILFKEYKKKIINFCYRFCADREVAQELAQEVFLRVYKAAPRYKPEAKFSTWIFRVATNVCLNELRKKNYQYKIESIDKTATGETGNFNTEIEDEQQLSSHEIIESKERNRLIKDALTNLPDKQRAALLLRIFHGFSYQEIGTQIKASQGNVKTLIHRGRQNLMKILSSQIQGE